jgi:hypothetical protein
MGDPKFASVYIKEKEELLPYLKGGDPSLYNRVEQNLAWAKDYLADPENTTSDPHQHAVSLNGGK